nr:unnamed protein product [Digitaria exilis]
MLFRRPGGLSATLSVRLRRSLSTAAAAASRPAWAMIHQAILDRSPDLRASFKLVEPPCPSHIFVPGHLVDPGPRPDPDSDTMSLLGGGVRAVSGDGLLLLHFSDGRATAPIIGRHGTSRARRLIGIDMDSDTTRFVCNPISGQLFRLPDIDGTKKTSSCKSLGILTHSRTPARAARQPFSDRPELRFVELPRGSLTEPMEGIRLLGRYRRMGVSEGRLHYAEVSQEEPFLLSSFVLENDGSWTLQHRVALTGLWEHPSDPCEEDKPRIGVIDPLNSSVMHLTLGNGTLSSNRAGVKSKTLSDILIRVERDKKN